MKFKLPAAVTTRAARTVLKAQKHSPVLLFAGGIVAGVGTVVTASMATLKVDDEVLTPFEAKKTKIKDFLSQDRPDYSEHDYQRDMVILHIQTFNKLGRLYAPALVLGVVSVACLTQSHRILVNRNAGLTAAYTAVSKGFDEYRARVRQDVGDEKEREYYYGAQKDDVTTVDKAGKKHTKQVTKSNREGGGVNAKFFGEENQNWSPQGEYNVAFLRGVQTFANQRLVARGHLFLNEILDDLGMERTSEGAILGWVKERGDFVDFGIWDDASLLRFHSFVVHNDGIWLDLNINQQPIWDAI